MQDHFTGESYERAHNEKVYVNYVSWTSRFWARGHFILGEKKKKLQNRPLL